MILRRLRSRAPLLVAVGLFLLAWTLTAKATTPVLESHMKEFVYWTFGVGAFALLGAGGAFVSYLMGRIEKSLDASISRLERQVEILGNDLIAHNASAFAHTAASEHNHGPMHAQSVRIEVAVNEVLSKVGTLMEGQRLAVEELTELDTRLGVAERQLGTLCAEHHILHGRALQARADDPPTVDLDRLRGRQ